MAMQNSNKLFDPQFSFGTDSFDTLSPEQARKAFAIRASQSYGESKDVNDAPDAGYITANELIETAFKNLDRGNVTGCSELVQQSLRHLGTNIAKYSREITICSKYIQVCKLVAEINDSKDLVKSCVYSRIVSGISDIRPKHKIICVRIAINKNMEGKNYRLVRKLILGVLNLNIKDKDQMNSKLKFCEDNNNKNFLKSSFLMKCPRCEATVDFSRDECIKCDAVILFCFATCMPISDLSYFQCSVCSQCYSQTSVTSSNAAKCQCCNLGVLEARKFKKINKSKSKTKSTEENKFSLERSQDLDEKPSNEKSKEKNKEKQPKPTKPEKSQSADKSESKSPKETKLSLEMPKWKGYLTVASNAKKEYTKYFKKADRNQDGKIDGEEAKSFFESSNVPKKILASLWRIADVDMDGALDKNEFRLFMHLLNGITNGEETPQKIPKELKSHEIWK